MISNIKFRCSAIGKLMTEPKTLKEGPLSVGAKTHVRQVVAQDLFGVIFEVTSKEMEKGIIVEPEGIALLNRVRGLQLVKNVERREDEYLTGEADLFDAPRRRGHDLKCPWSLMTFPIALADCYDRLYEWQMRGYMRLWDAEEWEVNYTMISTPDDLVRYEPQSLHYVEHIPEAHRLTTWVVKRDRELEEAMVTKIKHAREYYREVVEEFDRTHNHRDPVAAAIEMVNELAADVRAEAPPPAPPMPQQVKPGELPKGASLFD